LRQRLEVLALLGDDAARFRQPAFDEPAHFRVDLLRGRLGNVLLAAHRVAEEHLFLVLAIHDSAELVGETPARHHRARELRRLLDVRLRTRRDLVLAEDDLFGDTAAHQHRETRGHLLVAHRQLVAFGQLHDHAESAAARNDRCFVHGIGRRDVQRDDRMAAFVIGGEQLLLLGHDQRAALRAHHDLVLRILELDHGDNALAAPRRHQCRFVDEIHEIGAG